MTDWGGANSRFLGLVSVGAERPLDQTELRPSVIKRIRQMALNKYDTRYKNLFRIPKGTINYTSLSARLWNILNMKIDVHVPLSQFKSSVVNYLVNNTTEIKYSK